MEKTGNVRPPIVTILGHVDHGKTTLLDAIRKTSVASHEVGGITQKIGAYTVETPLGTKITFIDTPGHEAFQAMRSRGAKVADIVVLVIAANEGAKPQTRESISIIQDSKTPYIVAITKTDLANANVDQVKSELVSLGINLEGMVSGGDVPVVPVSAKTGDGIPDLLETISLLAEVHGLPGLDTDPLQAFVIESKADARRGPVATVVVRSGKISVGDEISAASSGGKVRAITNDQGESIHAILPGMAGEILGFASTPDVGSNVTLGGSKKEEAAPTGNMDVDPAKRMNIILKADTLGGLEAIKYAISPDVGILSSGVGDINQNDIMLSSSFSAPIVGFNVKVLTQVADLVQKEGAEIKLFPLIYEALTWINTPPPARAQEEEKIVGRAEVRAKFPYGEDDQIAGVMVSEGRITKGDRLRIMRDGEKVGESRVRTLHQRTNSIDTVPKGSECGIIFREKVDFKIGDVVESVKL